MLAMSLQRLLFVVLNIKVGYYLYFELQKYAKIL